MKVISGVSLVAGLLPTLLVGCGGSSTATVQGTVTPSSAVSSVFGPGMNASTYTACAVAKPMPGTQITLIDSSGKVIGTGVLGLWNHDSSIASGTRIFSCDMPFTISNVPSEPRYGFQINGVPGTIWENSVSPRVALEVTSVS